MYTAQSPTEATQSIVTLSALAPQEAEDLFRALGVDASQDFQVVKVEEKNIKPPL